MAALFSEGFYHPDEHFSTIELMHKKINPELDAAIFNWDITDSIRSYFQPWLYFILLAPFRLFKIDPFVQVMFLRFFHIGLFSLSLFLFLKSFLPTFKWKGREKFDALDLTLITLGTWFVPFIMVRTSSESLSISLMLLCLSFFLKGTRPQFFLSGLLGGLSFSARFQMGVPVFFLFLWGLFIAKKNWKDLLIFCVGVNSIFLFQGLVDYWGYGEWVFSPWNYLRENIVNSRAAEFGISPWYEYFKQTFFKGIPIISFPLLVGTFLYFFKNIRSPLTWVLVSFGLIHMGIGHKEMRFLNFIYIFTPMLFIFMFSSWLQVKRVRFLCFFVGIINVILLLGVLLFPTYKPIAIYKMLYRQVPSSENIYTLKGDNEGNLELMLRFYAKHPKKLIPLLLSELKEGQQKRFLLTSTYSEQQLVKSSAPCVIIDEIYPQWLLQYNFFKWRDRSAIWTLWQCQ
jgi:GPI mannosyltransferase 3